MTDRQLQLLLRTMIGELEEVVTGMEATMTPEKIPTVFFNSEHDYYPQTVALRTLIGEWNRRIDDLGEEEG